MRKNNADRRLAVLDRLRRPQAAGGVKGDVAVERFKICPCVLLAQLLHQRREHGIRGARALRRRHDHLPLQRGGKQVVPAVRIREPALPEPLLITGKADHTDVDRVPVAVCITVGLRHILQLIALIRLDQAGFGRVFVVVRRAAQQNRNPGRIALLFRPAHHLARGQPLTRHVDPGVLGKRMQID